MTPPARARSLAGERTSASLLPLDPADASTLPALARELAAGCRELGGKLAAYYLVRLRPHHRAVRGAGRGADLVELAVETCRREPRYAPFLLERLCYDFVRGLQRARRQPLRLLDGAAAAALPEQSLILLHAGLGMALADSLLGPLRRGGRAEAAALDRFAELVAANARPDYAPVCHEALGLMVRRFRPRLHAAVEERLRAAGPDRAAWYWHGAGRGIYFLAGLFHPFPGGLRRGLEICRRDPREPAHRLDAIAGFAFASTMINLRHPELTARLLPLLAPDEMDALASGIAGALLTRRHTSPDAPEVAAFLRPLAPWWSGGAGGRLAALWDAAVREPCAAALDRAYPVLRARGELATFARHRPLGTLLAETGWRPMAAAEPV